jgi:hypothetical protein
MAQIERAPMDTALTLAPSVTGTLWAVETTPQHASVRVSLYRAHVSAKPAHIAAAARVPPVRLRSEGTPATTKALPQHWTRPLLSSALGGTGGARGRRAGKRGQA